VSRFSQAFLDNFRAVSDTIRTTLSVLDPSNPSFSIMVRDLKHIVIRLGTIFIVITIAIYLWKFFGPTQFSIFNYKFDAFTIIGLAAILIVLLPMKDIWFNLRELIDSVSVFVMHSRRMQYTNKKRITRDILELILVVAITLNLPIILSFLVLPKLFVQIASFLMLAYALFIFWDINKTLKQKRF
jgi:hypothetical protein